MYENRVNNLPVIIGAGFSGMAISRTLGRKNINHILIGDAPNDIPPKLGESLNGEGSLDLEEFFPEFSQHYYPKKNIVFYTGKLVSSCNFDGSKWPQIVQFCKLTGFNIFNQLLHVDRVNFDVELFKQVTANENCQFIKTRVKEIKHSEEKNFIDEMTLGNNETIKPSFVFDTTNHAKLLPGKLNLPVQELGEKQRVVFTHYRIPANKKENILPQLEREPWIFSTSLLILHRKLDDIDGFSWCIPLGDSISVGISISAGENQHTDEEVMTLLNNAFARRGLNYRKFYNEETNIVSMPNQNRIFNRLYGKNWLLVGGTYCNVLFTTSAGLTLCLFVGLLADKFLKHPKKMMKQYEYFASKFLSLNDTHKKIVSSDLDNFKPEEMSRITDSLILTTFSRLCIYAQSRNGKIAALFASLIGFLIDKKIFKVNQYCKIIEANIADQTCSIYTKESGLNE